MAALKNYLIKYVEEVSEGFSIRRLWQDKTILQKNRLPHVYLLALYLHSHASNVNEQDIIKHLKKILDNAEAIDTGCFGRLATPRFIAALVQALEESMDMFSFQTTNVDVLRQKLSTVERSHKALEDENAALRAALAEAKKSQLHQATVDLSPKVSVAQQPSAAAGNVSSPPTAVPSTASAALFATSGGSTISALSAGSAQSSKLTPLSTAITESKKQGASTGSTNQEQHHVARCG